MSRCARLIAALALLGTALAAPRADGDLGLLIEIDGAIGPAVADYLERGLAQARARQAALVVLRLDTPGGLDASMRDMVKAILDSPVPVVGYVAPAGARAASAGTYLLYACHVAAMAPSTTLGAATPVRIGGLPGPPDAGRPRGDGQPPGGAVQEPSDPMERKLVNDAAAYLRGLAQRHGRNAEWAERAVREGASLSAEEALEHGIIDLLAADPGELLARLDGRPVRLGTGALTLATGGLALERVLPDWRNRLLAVLTDPTVAYVLLLVGVYGVIFELSNPGFGLPGVIGAIALLLALYAFQVLPINYAGLALIALGIAFMVGEALVPSFGLLGLGGLIAFVAGSLILLEDEQVAVSIPVIAGTAAVSAAFFIWVLGHFARLRRRRPVTGREELAGALGVALGDFTGDGRVRIHSESWKARARRPVAQGQRVRVIAVDGLVLEVDPVEEDH